MNFSIQIDTSGLEGLDELEERIDAAMEDGLDAVAERGLELKRENVSVLTGAWRDGQAIETDGPGQRRIVDTGPAAEPITNWPGGYAEKVSAQSNPAAERTHAQLEGEAQGIFEEALRKALG